MHNNDNRLSVEGPRQSGRTLVGIDAAITARHHVAVRDDQSHVLFDQAVLRMKLLPQ